MPFAEMLSSCQAKKIKGNGQEEDLERKNPEAKNIQKRSFKARESLNAIDQTVVVCNYGKPIYKASSRIAMLDAPM